MTLRQAFPETAAPAVPAVVEPPDPTVLVLERAAALVERGWTRGAQARDCLGKVVWVTSPEARNFCAVGAINRAAAELGAPPGQARMSLRKSIRKHSITLWNDCFAYDAGHVSAKLRQAANERRTS